MKIGNIVPIALFLIIGCTYPPHVLDDNGNPVFNSIPINEEDFGEYSISANYYTIIGNINNPNSSVYVSQKPTKEQIWKFSTTTPSYFWIIHKNRDVIKMIGLNENLKDWESNWKWWIVDVKNNTKIEVPTFFKGHLTEHRFLEVSKPDSLLKKELMEPDQGVLIPFNQKIYGVVPYKAIYTEVKNIVREYQLYDEDNNIRKVSIPPKAPPQNQNDIKKSEINDCSISGDSIFLVGNDSLGVAKKCLQSLFVNEGKIHDSKRKCHIVRLVLQSKDAGKTSSKINEISHDFNYLPPDKHQFIYTFFPSFHKCDTFTIVSQSSNQLVIGVASSNKTFQYFLSGINLYFDIPTLSLLKLAGNVQMHSTKWSKETNEKTEETNLCPYTIEYNQMKGLILPFKSSYMQEMYYEGIKSYRIDEMHYEY